MQTFKTFIKDVVKGSSRPLMLVGGVAAVVAAVVAAALLAAERFVSALLAALGLVSIWRSAVGARRGCAKNARAHGAAATNSLRVASVSTHPTPPLSGRLKRGDAA